MKIIDCTSPTELYCRYDGECRPQDVYIELDLRGGSLSASYHAPVTADTIPIDVRNGYLRRYTIPTLSGEAANRVMREIAPLAERVLADWHEIPDDGGAFVLLGGDADAAEEEIFAYLDANTDDDRDAVIAWTVDEAINGSDVAAEYGITAATTDERLAEIGAEIARDACSASDSGAVVVPDLTTYLRDLRRTANVGHD